MHRWSPLALVLCACANTSAPVETSGSGVQHAPVAASPADGTGSDASCRMVVAVTGMT